MKAILISLMVAAAMCCSAMAEKNNLMEGRSAFELQLGAWVDQSGAESRVLVSGAKVETSMGGFAGGLSYAYWLEENLAIQIGFTALVADLETSIQSIGRVSTTTATVTPILMGVRYYWPRSSFGAKVRPFVGAAVGTAFGSESNTRVDSEVIVESNTEVAFAGQAALGIDFLLGRHFGLGVRTGYNLLTDFSDPIGGTKNYSGGLFTFGVSYHFGG